MQLFSRLCIVLCLIAATQGLNFQQNVLSSYKHSKSTSKRSMSLKAVNMNKFTTPIVASILLSTMLSSPFIVIASTATTTGTTALPATTTSPTAAGAGTTMITAAATGGDLKTYSNERYHTTLSYPSDFIMQTGTISG